MKRFLSSIAVGAMVLAGMATVGISTASAATTTPTVVLSNGKAIVGQGPTAITATTSVAGTVSFTAASTAISGCTAVATVTSTATPPVITATCLWTATAPGAVVLGATFTPTDTTDYTTATAAAYTVNVAVPVQTVTGLSAIPLYVDTIVASGPAKGSPIYPIYGGCQITNEFLVGQTVVFRVFGYAADGTPLTPANVSSATVTVQGVTTPLVMSFANHGVTNTTNSPTGTGDGVAFWTAPLVTGGTGYTTLGLIPYTVTFHTILVPAVTKKVSATEWVLLRKKGKVVHVSGKAVYVAKKYMKTVIVTPAVPGATGTFTPNFNTSSSATLNAVPAS
jgi:hypothetical protein